MQPSVGTQIGPYRIVQHLGKGGMGEVHVGYDERLDRKVALKSIRPDHRPNPESKHRFLREARILSQLDHPNICQIFEYFEEEGIDFLVLELIQGQSLASGPAKTMDFARKLDIAAQIASALVAAHEKGIVHRDLKPDNVMLTAKGEVKVLDFGLSRLHQEEPPGPAQAAPPGQLSWGPEDDSVATGFAQEEGTLLAPGEPRGGSSSGKLTRMGAIMGTPGQMSPEQARGEEATTASDVYSFGLLLQELFTGNPPQDPSLGRAMLLMLGSSGVTLPLKGIDPDLAALITRMESLAPAARPSAVDVAERIDWIRAKPLRRRKKVLSIAAIALVAVFGVVMAFQAARISRAERAAKWEAETAKQVSEFLTGLFKVSDPGEARGSTITARELLDAGAARISSELREQPLVQSRLMDTMGTVYWRLGLYPQAQPLLEKAVRGFEATLGPDHPEVAAGLNHLGNLYCDQGRYVLAEPLYLRGLRILEKSGRKDHPDMAMNLGHLGSLYDDKGEYSRAEPFIRRSLELWERTKGPEHPLVAIALSNLAINAWRQGRYPEAEGHYLRSLRIREKALGPDHLDVAQSQMNLATLYTGMGRHQDAEKLLLQSQKIQERTLGPDHPIVARALLNLAGCYLQQNKWKEAEALTRRCLAIREKALGPEHPDVGQALGGLGVLATFQGRLLEAEHLLKSSLRILEKALGPGHPEVAECLYNLACVNAKQHRRGEAVALLRRALPGGASSAWKQGLRQDPDLLPLKGYPDFERLLAEAEGVKRRVP